MRFLHIITPARVAQAEAGHSAGAVWLQFLSRPFVVGDRIDILTSGGTKFATGFVERVDPIYTVLRTDTGTPVTINNKAWAPPLVLSSEMPRWCGLRQGVAFVQCMLTALMCP